MFRFHKRNSQAKRTAPTKQRRPLRWRRSYNWVFLLIPLSIAGGALYRSDDLLPIRSIQLFGTFENLDQADIETTLQQYIGQGFFSLDIHELRATLHARPWTDSVSVRRIWPDKLRVTIVEKKPVARWDERHLLSDKARIYIADTRAFEHLPRVHAIGHSPAWVLTWYYRLEARFDSVDERIVALEVDSRGALDVELINGLDIKFGRDDIERKIDRLISIYQPQILPRRAQIERLDLRYSNGFAVAWKKEALQASDEASIWSNSNV